MEEKNIYKKEEISSFNPKVKNKINNIFILTVLLLSFLFLILLLKGFQKSQEYLNSENNLIVDNINSNLESEIISETTTPSPIQTPEIEEFVAEIPEILTTSIELTKDKKIFKCSILTSDNLEHNKDKTSATSTKYGISDNVYIVYKSTNYKYYKMMETIVNNDKFAIAKIKGYVDYKAGSAKDFNSYKKIEASYTMNNNGKDIIFDKYMLFKLLDDNYILVHNITFQKDAMSINDLKILEKYLEDISNS